MGTTDGTESSPISSGNCGRSTIPDVSTWIVIGPTDIYFVPGELTRVHTHSSVSTSAAQLTSAFRVKPTSERANFMSAMGQDQPLVQNIKRASSAP